MRYSNPMEQAIGAKQYNPRKTKPVMDPYGPILSDDPQIYTQFKRRARKRSYIVFGIAALVLTLMAIGLWIFVVMPIGFGTVLVSTAAALVPFSIVMMAIWWLDRFSPQPKATLLYAFAWGAIGSVVLTLIFGTAVLILLTFQTQDATSGKFLAIAFQAPLVEEITKALGLIVLLLFGRRYISNPIDGAIYAMLIAAGFAFTENITYFARSLHEAQILGNSSTFWQTFLLRGIVSPFAHASFTSFVGIGLGIAAERRNLGLYLALGFGGLSIAMVLHALWNGGSMWVALNGDGSLSELLIWYLIIEVPIFLIWASMLIWLRIREGKVIRRRLNEYVNAGWFSLEEVEMLTRIKKRKAALKWAASFGAVNMWAMRDFQRCAIALAINRQSSLNGKPLAKLKAREAKLLRELTHHRSVVASLTQAVVLPSWAEKQSSNLGSVK